MDTGTRESWTPPQATFCLCGLGKVPHPGAWVSSFQMRGAERHPFLGWSEHYLVRCQMENAGRVLSLHHLGHFVPTDTPNPCSSGHWAPASHLFLGPCAPVAPITCRRSWRLPWQQLKEQLLPWLWGLRGSAASSTQLETGRGACDTSGTSQLAVGSEACAQAAEPPSLG